MKKLLFAAYTLDVGGIETALVNLLNNLIERYDVTLVLEKKQGIFLKELNSKIKLIEYNPNQNKNILIRKSINLLKRIKFIIKYKNEFDFAGSFATYSKMGSFCARTASKNNALWIHTNYLEFYNGDKERVVQFFNFIDYNKFSNYVFVSENSNKSFVSIFKETENNGIVIHNLIDYKRIIEKSKKRIDLKKEPITTFLNVARHEEQSKKITRLLEAIDVLKKDNLKFRVLLVGNGVDTERYKKIVQEKELSDYVIFAGEKNNPYPYFTISDAVILTSEYEGYPVVFDEARVLDLPIITTDVSDSKGDIDNKYGLVTEKNSKDIYLKMKSFIEYGYIIKEKFDAEYFNKESLGKLEKIINGGNNA